MNRNSIQLYQFSATRLTILNIAIALRLSRSQKNLKRKKNFSPSLIGTSLQEFGHWETELLYRYVISSDGLEKTLHRVRRRS